MLSETMTACVRLLVFFGIRHGTFPYGVEDDASTISQTPTTHYTNTCVKLTTVTHISFSERTAIANLSFNSISAPVSELSHLSELSHRGAKKRQERNDFKNNRTPVPSLARLRYTQTCYEIQQIPFKPIWNDHGSSGSCFIEWMCIGANLFTSAEATPQPD